MKRSSAGADQLACRGGLALGATFVSLIRALVPGKNFPLEVVAMEDTEVLWRGEDLDFCTAILRERELVRGAMRGALAAAVPSGIVWNWGCAAKLVRFGALAARLASCGMGAVDVWDMTECGLVGLG